jgi:general secretion pathway protein D
MEVALEFSTAGAPQGQLGAVPINKRTADTTIIARDQQPAVIGGLTRETEVTGSTKIPVLGDIPVLGALFRSTSDQERKVSLLLILTPHVVESQADLRGIFERKMQQRQQFINRYFAFDDTLPWEPPQDYERAVGLLEHIRQSQLDLEAEAQWQQALADDEPQGHGRVEPLALPSKVKPVRKVKKKKRRRKKRTRKKRSRRRRRR